MYHMNEDDLYTFRQQHLSARVVILSSVIKYLSINMAVFALCPVRKERYFVVVVGDDDGEGK